MTNLSTGTMETWRRQVIALRSVWKGHIFQWGGGSCEKRLNRDWFTKPKKGREWKERPAQKRKGEKLR